MSAPNVVAVALSVVAGVAGGLQVSFMGRFGGRVGTIEALAFAAAATGVISLVVLLIARRSLHGYAAALHVPKWLWLAPFFGALVVFTVTLAAPRLGTFATIAVFIAGQIAIGVAIDAFGLFGTHRIGISASRVVGVVLLAGGAMLALRK